MPTEVLTTENDHGFIDMFLNPWGVSGSRCQETEERESGLNVDTGRSQGGRRQVSRWLAGYRELPLLGMRLRGEVLNATTSEAANA